MTLFLRAGMALILHATAIAIAAFIVLVALSAGAMAQEVIQAQPAPLPPETPTITLWRDGAIMAALVIGIGTIIWRASMLDAWVRSRTEFHGLAAALLEDELIKRGVVKEPASPSPEPTLEPIDDPWAVEADRVAPPPPAPAPRPKLHVAATASKSAQQMAAKFSHRTRAKGNA
jgi:hypothetical protein